MHESEQSSHAVERAQSVVTRVATILDDLVRAHAEDLLKMHDTLEERTERGRTGATVLPLVRSTVRSTFSGSQQPPEFKIRSTPDRAQQFEQEPLIPNLTLLIILDISPMDIHDLHKYVQTFLKTWKPPQTQRMRLVIYPLHASLTETVLGTEPLFDMSCADCLNPNERMHITTDTSTEYNNFTLRSPAQAFGTITDFFKSSDPWEQLPEICRAALSSSSGQTQLLPVIITTNPQVILQLKKHSAVSLRQGQTEKDIKTPIPVYALNMLETTRGISRLQTQL